MSDPYFQKLFADRIGGASYGKGSDIYKFEKIKRAKRKALADFPERLLIDFGIGENDRVAPDLVRARMADEIHRPENRGYADNGIFEFKQAAARFMERNFGVLLDPDTQVNHCIGSKTALAMLPATLINPGDVTLMTVPGYPVAGSHTRFLGGLVHPLPLLAENDFLPDLDSIPSDSLARAKLLVLNYPNSPTGKVATTDFYQRVVALAKEHEIVVIQDAAHIVLTYQGKPLSFLSVPGAMDVGVEVHSMSKGFDMIGWRIGWVCGHRLLVQAFADVKDNCDSGQFIAIQKSAAAALDDDRIPKRVQQRYERRLTKLVAMLTGCGFDCRMPGGTYFLYVRAPRGVSNGPTLDTAEAASQYLIAEHSIVTVPWDDAGAYLRFSVTYEAEDEPAEDALMAAAESRLKQIKPVAKMTLPDKRIAWLLLMLLTVSACGGGGTGTDDTPLNEQYRRALNLDRPESRAKGLVQVALKQSQAADRAGAEKSLSEAGRACSQIEDPLGRASALSRLADAQGSLGMRTKTRDSMVKVREALGQVDSIESKITIMARMALTYGQHLGNDEAARSTLSETEALVDQLSGQNVKVRGLTVVAYAQHLLKHQNEAERLANQATGLARQLEDPRRRSDAISEVASTLSRMSRSDQANVLFDESLGAARQIEDNVSQAHALADLATRLSQAAQKKKASEILVEAEEVGDGITDRGLNREVMEKIAQAKAAL